MNSDVLIERAGPADLGAIRELLVTAGLPTDGIDASTEICLVVRKNGSVVGSAALEIYDTQGLLRSVAVRPAERGRGTGARLVRAVLEEAAGAGVTDVVLLTTDASGYFERFGFRVVERSALTGPVVESPQFTVICPASATSMSLNLKTA